MSETNETQGGAETLCCPICETPSAIVLTTQAARGGFARRRRRKCARCGGEWNTIEVESFTPPVAGDPYGYTTRTEEGKCVAVIEYSGIIVPTVADADTIARKVRSCGTPMITHAIVRERLQETAPEPTVRFPGHAQPYGVHAPGSMEDDPLVQAARAVFAETEPTPLLEEPEPIAVPEEKISPAAPLPRRARKSNGKASTEEVPQVSPPIEPTERDKEHRARQSEGSKEAWKLRREHDETQRKADTEEKARKQTLFARTVERVVGPKLPDDIPGDPLQARPGHEWVKYENRGYVQAGRRFRYRRGPGVPTIKVIAQLEEGGRMRFTGEGNTYSTDLPSWRRMNAEVEVPK